MSKISDELRKIADECLTGTTNRRVQRLAVRIDAEMVELPRDADGKPIHVGETVYDLDGYEHMAVSHHLYSEEDPTWMVSVGGGSVYPRDLTHKRPDSLERIAEELDDFKLGRSLEDLRAIADRIRKLAKERKHES